jgi:hypothetical protein
LESLVIGVWIIVCVYNGIPQAVVVYVLAAVSGWITGYEYLCLIPCDFEWVTLAGLFYDDIYLMWFVCVSYQVYADPFHVYAAFWSESLSEDYWDLVIDEPPGWITIIDLSEAFVTKFHPVVRVYAVANLRLSHVSLAVLPRQQHGPGNARVTLAPPLDKITLSVRSSTMARRPLLSFQVCDT